MKKTTCLKTLLFLCAFFFVSNSLVNAQTYRYLKIEVIFCDNFKIQEIDWYESGVAHPTSTMTSNSSAGMEVLGEGGGEMFQQYDDDTDTHHWYGYITDPLLAEQTTLDLGAGNGILPDRIDITKPGYSTLQYFQVWASNDNLNWDKFLDTTLASSGWATESFPLALDVDTEDPTAPQNLMASYITDNSLSLFWEAATDNVEVTEYEVYQHDVSIGTTSNTSMYVSGLTSATNYDYYVVARDFPGNESPQSTEISVFTSVLDAEDPTAPSALVSTNVTSELIELSWTASIDNIGVIGYIIYLDGVSVGTSDGTTFALPGLEASTSYDFTVKAKDASGNISLASNTLTESTTAAGVQTMKIGTNFWDVAWGGSTADPFKDSYQLVTGDNPWRTELLDETSIYCGFRFMDWGKTNNSTLDHWMGRKQKSDIEQRDIAYEWMIDFCNKTNSDIWLCIPHLIITRNEYERGDNHFVKKMAILLKTGVDMIDIDLDGPAFADMANMTRQEFIYAGGVPTNEPLKPELKIYIEYSNETWNFGFAHARYLCYEGDAVGLAPTPAGGAGENYTAASMYHAWAALRVFEQMEEVLGTATPRLIKMDAYQAVNVSSIITNHLNVYTNATYNPLGLYPDAFSPAPYFGNGVDGNAGTAVADLNASIVSRMAALQGTRAFLDGKETELSQEFKMIAYEGGQHVTTAANVINIDPAMYTLYETYLNACSAYLDEFWHYAHSGNFGDGGAWGSKEFIGQDIVSAHKYRALVDFGGVAPIPADTIPPSVPANLTSSTVTQTSVTLTWDAATDNDAMNGYQIFQNGFYIGYSNTTSFQVNGLSSNSQYDFTVTAVDQSGNFSAQSSVYSVSTMSVNSYNVTFTVTNGTDPLEGATVTFRSQDVLTNSSGVAVFANILSGTGLSYSVTMAAYDVASGTIDVVSADANESVTLIMTVGISISKNNLLVYPIPASNILNIQSQNAISEISIVDMTGRKVLLLSADGQNSISVNVSELVSGMYYLSVVREDGVENGVKVVVE